MAIEMADHNSSSAEKWILVPFFCCAAVTKCLYALGAGYLWCKRMPAEYRQILLVVLRRLLKGDRLDALALVGVRARRTAVACSSINSSLVMLVAPLDGYFLPT